MGPSLSVSCECISNASSFIPTASILLPHPTPRPDSLTSNSTMESALKTSLKEASPLSSKLTIHDFLMLKILGKGAYGKVLLVTRKRHTSKLYAMKIVQKSQVYANDLTLHIKLEKETLKNSNSPFVVKLHYSFQTPTKIYLVMDYLSGGDLFNLLRKKKRFSLQTAKFYLAEVVLALEYLHQDLKLIYRDLKPENIFVDGEGTNLKIIDFGTAQYYLKRGNLQNTEKKELWSPSGTESYRSPEQICGKSNEKSDIYALGLILYEMVTKKKPFGKKKYVFSLEIFGIFN